MSPVVPFQLLALAAGIALATTAAAADTPPEVKPYRDRIIAADSLAPLPPDEDLIEDPAGLPRSLALDLLVSRTERGGESFAEQGLSVSSFWETRDKGTFSLDATLLRSDRRQDGGDPWGGTATLWQRGLHAHGGWRVNNGLGVLNSPLPPLLREQYRFFLPSVSLAGASSEWQQHDRGLTVQAAYGRAGLFDGARVVGFDVAEGDVASAGAQWTWAPRWTGAMAYLGADGRLHPDGQGGARFDTGSTRALLFANAWQGDRDSVHLNLQASRGVLGDAGGAWLDARAQRGRYTHHYGAFSLDPGLAWGSLPINNDARGVYYRASYQHARWNWNAGVDHIQSITGRSFDGNYGNGFVRYQATTSLGYGGSLSVRESAAGTAHSSQVFVDKRTRWGQTRLQYEQAVSGDGDSWQLSVDQALPMQQGSRLSLSLTHGSLSYGGEPSTASSSIAAIGGFDLTERLTADGTLRYTHGDGPAAFRGADLNLNLNWRLATRWWLIATVYENRGSRRSPFLLDPLAPDNPFITLPRDRSIFLNLRYQRQAGTPMAVIGGTPGGAVGSIRGSVFLDENRDGERAASELPAANVTVVLDGRYSVRTDSQGNFEFPRVATGKHELTVLPDNLPLPWFFEPQSERRVIEVKVRDTQRVDIGARRER